MTTLLTQSFNINAKNGGTRTFGPWNVPDGLRSLTAKFTEWPQATKLTLVVEMSFDGGSTWKALGGLAAAAPATLRDGSRGVFITVDGLWQMCQCGEVYVPDHPANPGLQTHSTYRGWSSEQIAALGDGWLHELDPAAFHNPDLTRDTSLPQRQGRVTATIDGPITTTVTASVN